MSKLKLKIIGNHSKKNDDENINLELYYEKDDLLNFQKPVYNLV